MVPIEQVKSDLREIRYYYSRKEQLEDASHSIGSLCLSVYPGADAGSHSAGLGLYVAIYPEADKRTLYLF